MLPKIWDFIASKSYGKVTRPFFPPPQRKMEKAVWPCETKLGSPFTTKTPGQVLVSVVTGCSQPFLDGQVTKPLFMYATI